MTGPARGRRPGRHPEELISASLTGDLTGGERRQLDAHLAECATCRATLAAFSEQRQLVSALRHRVPPRDLGVRVRSGIDSGRFATPWWRRPGLLVGVGASLATVAAAVLAVVVFTNMRPGVGQVSGSPTVSPRETAAVSASVAVSPPASPLETSAPSAGPIAVADPIGRLTYRISDQQPRMEFVTPEGAAELQLGTYGTPIDAALSPDGDWLAFRVQGEGSGLVDTYAYRISDETLIPLAQRSQDSPFSRLAWSPEGDLLAFTVINPNGRADAWVFSPSAPEPAARRLTNSGSAFAASFHRGTDDAAWLWVSVAGPDPATYRVAVPRDGSIGEPIDPAAESIQDNPGAFLPIVNPPGAPLPAVALWHGQMVPNDSGWHFERGGMLYFSHADASGEYSRLGEADEQVFKTLSMPPGGEAFESARFAWAPDGDGFAVWDALWISQGQPEGFPDEQRVYFGHLTTATLIGPDQALDEADTQGQRVVHVALGGGQYLAVTVQTAEGSEGGTYGPSAEMRVVTRNLGNVPDEVQDYGGDRVWVGPAIYPADLTGDQ